MRRKKLDLDYWVSDKGQAELKRKVEERAKPPEAKPGRWRKTGVMAATTIPTASLSPLDYTEATKQHLSPVGPASEEWFEIEMTADSGACDTVIPKSMCPGIPIMPSFQSLRKMEYEVANGE